MFLGAELVEVSAQFLVDFFTISIALLVLYTFSLYSQFLYVVCSRCCLVVNCFACHDVHFILYTPCR